MRLGAADIHARLAGGRWTEVLRTLGVADEYLRRRKSGPCPVCGGRDRYTYDDKHGHGDFICRHCGAGDGFTLLMRLNRWTFSEASRQVARAAGFDSDQGTVSRAVQSDPKPATVVASPTRRARDVLRTSCEVADVWDAREYLSSRCLWPLPAGCALRAHAGMDYYSDKVVTGRYAALVAPVRDIDGELVTVHVTYIDGGKKLSTHEPRKMLSPLAGREGCAVQLMPLAGDALGIGEGIETCLAAAKLNQVPTWAALNTSVLAKFEPPAAVTRLLIFADRDAAGLEAASRLAERLQGRVTFELKLPTAPAKDWADSLSQVSHE